MQKLPYEWEWKKLGDVCKIIMGQSPPSETYNTIGNGLPFFQGKAEFTNLYPVVRKWCNNPNKIAERNDILLSVRAPVGSTNIANQKCCIGRGLAAIRYENNYKYIFYFLRSIERELDKKGTGTTFKAISGEVLRNIEVPIPSISTQNKLIEKIEELFSELDKGVESLNKVKAQLKIYRQSVLKSAFSGELTKEWRERHKDIYEISENIFITKNKAELLKILELNYKTSFLQNDLVVLKDVIIEGLCKNIPKSLLDKIIENYPFDVIENRQRSFFLWQTKSDEFLKQNGFDSLVLSHQRKSWLDYSEEKKSGRVLSEPLLGYSLTGLIGNWLESNLLRVKGSEYLKNKLINEPSRNLFNNELQRRITNNENLPNVWKIMKLVNVCTKIVGGGTPSTKENKYFDGDIIWLTPTEIDKNNIVTISDSKRKITGEGYSNSSATFVPPETVLMTSRASIGYVAIAGTELTTNQGFANFVCKPDICNKYLAYWLKMNKKRFEDDATGTTFKEISKSKLKEYEIQVPDIIEQRKIVEEIESRLSICDKIEESVNDSLQSAESLRQSILKKAFEGKLI